MTITVGEIVARLAAATCRADTSGLALDVAAVEGPLRAALPKGTSTPLVRCLGAARIHLSRAGGEVRWGVGVRLAEAELAAAVEYLEAERSR